VTPDFPTAHPPSVSARRSARATALAALMFLAGAPLFAQAPAQSEPAPQAKAETEAPGEAKVQEAAPPPRSRKSAAAAAQAEPAPSAGAPTSAPAGEAAPFAPPPAKEVDEDQPPLKTEIQRGTGQFINLMAAQRVPAGPQVGEVTFNFEGESLQAVIKAILGDMLQENYVIAPGVQGQVTFSTAKPINSSQAMAVLEMLLAWNNATLVYKDGRYTVLPVQQAVPGNLIPRFGAVGDTRGYEVRIVPLRYVAPAEMEKLLQPYARPGAVIRVDNARAFIVLGGTRADLQNYLDTIEVFDVNWLTGMSVGIFPLERVEAKVVVPELEKVFGEGSGTPMAGMFRFMPIDRLNAVLVITPQPQYLEEAQTWLSRLDRGGSEAGAQIYVYYVKNVKAKDLAGNLTDIFGGSTGSGGKPAGSGSVVPGIESVEISSQTNVGDKDAAAKPAARPSPGGGISAKTGDDIRITAIEESNALLIRATPGAYGSILQAIKRLDEVPLQVHIEAKILQVDLTGKLALGVKWFFENSTGLGTTTPAATAALRTNRPVWNSYAGSINPGLSWTFLNQSAEAFVSALDDMSKTRVLAAPSLVALNNKKASFNVGKQIPVVSSIYNPGIINGGTGTGNNNGIGVGSQSYVQFRDTGITLNVTPRVNPGGLVFLEIKQVNSTPGETADPTGNVPVDKAEIETEIAVQSGETVMLGGLIKESSGRASTGIPGLSRIPVLGALFGNTSQSKVRQEILVLLTPTVIENADQARDLTEGYSRQFKGLKPLLKRSGLDLQAEQPDGG